MVIIAAVDQSERGDTVVKEAESLAEAFDDTIHVIHVLPRSEFVELGRTAADNLDDSFSLEQVKEVAADVAADAVNDLETTYETIGLVGNPSDRIVEYANEQDSRYIVVAGRKRSPTGKAVFGSTSQSVLLNSKSPVVSVINNNSPSDD